MLATMAHAVPLTPKNEFAAYVDTLVRCPHKQD
jgi:hypothetical protein